jgi:hypothetical protein
MLPLSIFSVLPFLKVLQYLFPLSSSSCRRFYPSSYLFLTSLCWKAVLRLLLLTALTPNITYPLVFYAVVLVNSSNVSEEPGVWVIELKGRVLCTHDILLLSECYISKYDDQASRKRQGHCLGKYSGGALSTDGELLLFKLFCGNRGNLDE